MTRPAGTILWVCDMCRRQIGDGDGWVTTDLDDVMARQHAYDDLRSEHQSGIVRIGELLALPDEVAWHVYHKGCDPDISGNSYWFDIDRIRTVAEVMDWWLHLSEKNWFEHTDWDDLIRHRIMPQLEATTS